MLGVRETCPAEISDGSHSAGSERKEGEYEEGGRKEG